MALDAIRDQAEAVTLLRRAIASERVAHAYAFVGPEGSGRKATALAFASALVAPQGGPAAARVERGSHPDVHLLGPTPPPSNPKGTPALRIEAIRELERRASLKPAEAAWKVFIVDEAEKMTASTPQALLKTLEEPPARTVIILVLSQIRALPATVLSRCQVVRFLPRLVAGAPALFPDVSGEAHTRSLRLLAEAREQGVEAILRLGDQVGRDRPAAEAFVQACWLWHRDLLCAAAGAPALAVFGEAAAKAGGGRSLDRVLGALRDCREAWFALQGSVSPRLSVEVLLGRLTGKAA
ncbi:MAG TPA: DNA polymerase III subunit [Methylomirabilota bacterium]|nr:DNA polymerase III subunit [Methylomirabilota bacterium]